jgi:hypothetical protein
MMRERLPVPETTDPGTLVMDPVLLQKRKAVIAVRATIFVHFWASLCAAHDLPPRDMSPESAVFWQAFPLTPQMARLFKKTPEDVLV